MELSTIDCYGMSIVTNDNKKLGSFVNLVINKTTSEATLVAFPGLKSEWAFKKAGKVASTISGLGTRVLQAMVPELYDVVNVASEVQYEVVSEVSERSDRRAMKISETYYCIPAMNVKEVYEDSLMIDLDLKECMGWYRNVVQPAESAIAFFDQSYYNGPYRSNPISLNLQGARGMLVSDPSGLSARVIDVKFDTSTGNVSCIVVDCRGEKKSIDRKFIQIAYEGTTSSVGFQEGLSTTAIAADTRQVYLRSTRTEVKRKIIVAIDRPKTADELAKDLGFSDSSEVLVELDALQKDGSVICLTPEFEEDRQFYLTESGVKTKKVLLGEEKFENMK